MYKYEDILIRSVQSSDARILLKWENDPANWQVSDTKEPYTLEEIIGLIESLQDIETALQARYMIIEKQSGVPIGAVDLFDIDFVEEKASVGILVANTDDRNKGAAGIALLRLEEECREELGISFLTAKVHRGNAPSLRLFERLGYIKRSEEEGKIKNAEYIQTVIFEKWLKK